MRSYTWRYRDAAGKSRQVTSRSLEDVRSKRDEIRDRLNKGTYRDPRNGRTKVSDYATKWLAARKPFLDYNTWQTHEKRVRNHIVPKLGDLRMDQLDAQAIEEFQADLADGRSLDTVRCYFSTFNQIIGDALDKGVLGVDPRKGTTKIKTEWLKKKFPFEPGETDAIEGMASGELRRLIKIKRGTGLRISELLALDDEQIDWTEGAETLHVDRQIGDDADHGTIIKDPKSAKGDRVIPLPAWVVEALNEQRQARAARPRDMTWVHRDKTTQTVTARLFFHNGDGTPRKYHQIKRDWDAVVTAADIRPKGDEGTGIHRLRHTYAGDLIRQGVDIYVVSRLMGHSSVRVTEKYYAHLRKETLESAREALNGLRPRPRLALVRTA
ncbi:MAG: tyrosine-type recombinase/integrase [Streptosporangiales bacterium]|nr:tyrosine-type recombinase/integrase [Streptosporangiales bacterium]